MKRQIQVKEVVRKYVREWMNRDRISRETVAMELVEVIASMGLTGVLAEDGSDIAFRTTGDAFAMARTNAQQLFRWLGVAEDGIHTDGNRVLELLPAILSAMPADIRSACGNELLADTGLCVASAESGEGACLDVTLGQMIKECSEAQSAVLALKLNPSTSPIAVREINEAVAALQNALATIERIKNPSLKAVE